MTDMMEVAGGGMESMAAASSVAVPEGWESAAVPTVSPTKFTLNRYNQVERTDQNTKTKPTTSTFIIETTPGVCDWEGTILELEISLNYSAEGGASFARMFGSAHAYMDMYRVIHNNRPLDAGRNCGWIHRQIYPWITSDIQATRFDGLFQGNSCDMSDYHPAIPFCTDASYATNETPSLFSFYRAVNTAEGGSNEVADVYVGGLVAMDFAGSAWRNNGGDHFLTSYTGSNQTTEVADTWKVYPACSPLGGAPVYLTKTGAWDGIALSQRLPISSEISNTIPVAGTQGQHADVGHVSSSVGTVFENVNYNHSTALQPFPVCKAKNYLGGGILRAGTSPGEGQRRRFLLHLGDHMGWFSQRGAFPLYALTGPLSFVFTSVNKASEACNCSTNPALNYFVLHSAKLAVPIKTTQPEIWARWTADRAQEAAQLSGGIIEMAPGMAYRITDTDVKNAVSGGTQRVQILNIASKYALWMSAFFIRLESGLTTYRGDSSIMGLKSKKLLVGTNSYPAEDVLDYGPLENQFASTASYPDRAEMQYAFYENLRRFHENPLLPSVECVVDPFTFKYPYGCTTVIFAEPMNMCQYAIVGQAIQPTQQITWVFDWEVGGVRFNDGSTRCASGGTALDLFYGAYPAYLGLAIVNSQSFGLLDTGNTADGKTWPSYTDEAGIRVRTLICEQFLVNFNLLTGDCETSYIGSQ